MTAAKPGQPGGACKVQMFGYGVRAGDNIIATMSTRSDNSWCFGGFGFSGLSIAGSAVVDNPSHGESRLVQRPGGILYGYRPAAGYVGSDSFLITVPAGIGIANNLAVSVTVTP